MYCHELLSLVRAGKQINLNCPVDSQRGISAGNSMSRGKIPTFQSIQRDQPQVHVAKTSPFFARLRV
jgi:hypothetical protein